MLNQKQIRILDKLKEAFPYMTEDETSNLLVSSETLSTLATVRKDKQLIKINDCASRNGSLPMTP